MPYSERSNYEHHRQKPPGKFDPKTFRNVPLSHTKYRGKKHPDPCTRAIVGKENETDEWEIQSILDPKPGRLNADCTPKKK